MAQTIQATRRGPLRVVLFGCLSVAVLAVLFIAIVLALGRIPFLEGDRIVRTGEAYGFRIGMDRSQVMGVLKKRYAVRGNDLRVVWKKSDPVDARLAVYENTDQVEHLAREYGEHRVGVAGVTGISDPLLLCDEWRLEMPADWVNSIYLSFQDGRLVSIQRSKWLFERP